MAVHSAALMAETTVESELMKAVVSAVEKVEMTAHSELMMVVASVADWVDRKDASLVVGMAVHWVAVTVETTVD